MIEFENISFSYEGQDQGGLNDINLKISDGECILFCGRSGCGKTTITRLVNGLIPQFYQGELHGNVLIDGQEIFTLPMYQIAAKVGSVFQNPRTQFFNIDTDSEIAFGIENEARPPQELADRVNQTTEDLHIQKLRNRNIFELSGGEKQKIAFASVYAMNPEIYLLDEPSSNLDMASIQELKEHLQLIKSQGKTILIAEHRLYYLMELADRIVYLEKGKIKKIFTPNEFRQLSEDNRECMGLRAVDLINVLPPSSHSPVFPSTLTLRDITLRYKKRTILRDIYLSAAKGEIIGVVGHNGAGKTTFSRALCGLHKDCDGQFLWNGQLMEHNARLKHSYMVMQDVNYELFADSVESECSFGIRNPDQTLVEVTLENLGLTAYRERHPNTLSGGQKQRVAVAVSMVCEKDLLVFDEPTSGLDFDSMAQVAGLILRLSKMGKLIFIVTHDFEFVCSTCSRVLHFDEGEMPDDVPVVMDALPKLRELFNVSDRNRGDKL
ncbi:MAG: ABC transporter ATP-binding protein [Clostridiales bacterium]|nr:ABC transporter ATP-binding protein [Clostridiales bacterium]